MAGKNTFTQPEKEIRKCSLRCSEVTLEKTGIGKIKSFQSGVTALCTDLPARTYLEGIGYILMLGTDKPFIAWICRFWCTAAVKYSRKCLSTMKSPDVLINSNHLSSKELTHHPFQLIMTFNFIPPVYNIH